MIQRRRDDANAGQPLSHQPATLTYQVGLFQPLFQYRQFIVRQAIADLRHRYAGTAMGIAWNVIHPLGMILVISIVFSGVIAVTPRRRRESLDRDFLSRACFLMAFSDCIIRCCDTFVTNAAYRNGCRFPRCSSPKTR